MGSRRVPASVLVFALCVEFSQQHYEAVAIINSVLQMKKQTQRG